MSLIALVGGTALYSLLARRDRRTARRARRSSGRWRASASSSGCSSRSRGSGRGELYRWLGTERLQTAAPHARALSPSRSAAGRSGAPSGCGRAAPPSFDPLFAMLWAGRRRLRARRRLAGEVPPLRRAGAGRRRRARHLPHLRLALGARPRGDPAPRRDRHHRPPAARPALAAEAARGDRRRRRAVGARCAAAATSSSPSPAASASPASPTR